MVRLASYHKTRLLSIIHHPSPITLIAGSSSRLLYDHVCARRAPSGKAIGRLRSVTAGQTHWIRGHLLYDVHNLHPRLVSISLRAPYSENPQLRPYTDLSDHMCLNLVKVSKTGPSERPAHVSTYAVWRLHVTRLSFPLQPLTLDIVSVELCKSVHHISESWLETSKLTYE